jgi:hypothetical protein
MIPVPEDASRQDVDQWCSRSVVMVPVADGTYIPAWYMNVSDSRSVRAEPLDQKYGSLVVVPHHRVCVAWPLCGSVNIPGKGFAVHAARVTQKQYRRSWHQGALKVTVPRAWDVAKRFGVTPDRFKPGDQDLALACFVGTYPTLDEADEQITKGDVLSVALNRWLIMVGDTDGKRMFYVDGALAVISSGNKLYPVGTERAFYRVAKATEGRYGA